MATDSSSYRGDPFLALGVPATATRDEVKRAFRRQARETHPDHRPDDPDATQRFAALRSAYEAALQRLELRERADRTRPRAAQSGLAARGRGISEHELAMRVSRMSDSGVLRRVLDRHGYRPLIGAALARNMAFPPDALAVLRCAVECHWTVDTAIANRADVPRDILFGIARLAREPVVGLAVTANARCDSAVLDALIGGPIRLDANLENALAAHAELSVEAAARLAGRHATAVTAVVRLVNRGDLPEDMLRRLATQTARPQVMAAARNDLHRRGLPVPPTRDGPRAPRTLAGHWR